MEEIKVVSCYKESTVISSQKHSIKSFKNKENSFNISVTNWIPFPNKCFFFFYCKKENILSTSKANAFIIRPQYKVQSIQRGWDCFVTYTMQMAYFRIHNFHFHHNTDQFNIQFCTVINSIRSLFE